MYLRYYTRRMFIPPSVLLLKHLEGISIRHGKIVSPVQPLSQGQIVTLIAKYLYLHLFRVYLISSKPLKLKSETLSHVRRRAEHIQQPFGDSVHTN